MSFERNAKQFIMGPPQTSTVAEEVLREYRKEVLREAVETQRRRIAHLEDGTTTMYSLWCILSEHTDSIDPDKEG